MIRIMVYHDSIFCVYFFFFSSRRRHTRLQGDWSSDVCSSDLPQQRIGDADIALGVLEVDRINLVRHGGGADLARFHLLREVAERDVTPDVAEIGRASCRERV